MYSSLLTLLVLWLACCHVCGQTSLSDAEKDEVLDAHNYFRSRVRPIATNMEKMVWNNDLATVAQNYAEQCIFDHNRMQTSQQSTFSYVGENLDITTSSNVNYTKRVEGWNDEVSSYDYNSDQCSDVCGHYTQVVWANSNNLGCGAYRCPNPIPGFKYPNGLILVCNYGPGGNYNGEWPYSTGAQTCSACPTGQTFCASNLCSTTGISTTMSPVDTTGSTVSISSVDTTGSSVSMSPVDTTGSSVSMSPVDTTGSSVSPVDTTGSSVSPVDTTGSSVSMSSVDMTGSSDSMSPVETTGSSVSMSSVDSSVSMSPVETTGSSVSPVDTTGSSVSMSPVDTTGSSVSMSGPHLLSFISLFSLFALYLYL